MGQLIRCLTTIATVIVVLATGIAVRANPIATFNTSLGSFQVELFADDAPLTVANFLNYVNDGDYDGTFVHRTVPNLVIQGGGYAFQGNLPSTPHIPTDPPVVNEFSPAHSNVRGTIGMARTTDPDSATSQWFINLVNNSANLDIQSGGFTVFGNVLGNGMQVVDAIAALPRINAGGAFRELPVLHATPVFPDDLVVLNSIAVPEPATFVCAAAAVAVWLVGGLRATRRRPAKSRLGQRPR